MPGINSCITIIGIVVGYSRSQCVFHFIFASNLKMSSEDATAVFSIFDYVVFATMLIISSLIGVYFAYFAKVKQNTPSEYLMGSKSIGVLPMSMSLLAR